MTGFFVSFEGIDKCGKSTQATLLTNHLKAIGYDVLLTREPGATVLGRELRHLLLTWKSPESVSPEAEMLMFAADRAQHVVNLIRPTLQAGKCVITDRFIDSTFAYQGYGRGLDIGRLKTIQNIATDGLLPDMTIWVDIEVKTSRARMGLSGKDRMELESDKMFEKVRSGYAELYSAYPERIVRVDGEKKIQEVFQDILKAVMPRIS